MVAEFEPVKCKDLGEAFLPTPIDTTRDNIDPSRAIINPELLVDKEENSLSAKEAETTPVWESDYAERYSTAPGLARFVIWNYNPNNEGVKKYNKFDEFDPLPHHYYTSDKEYIQARMSYKAGIYPDRRIDVNSFFLPQEKTVGEIFIFSHNEEISSEDEVKVA